MLTCSNMDVKLCYLFVCLLHTSWCLEPNNQKTNEDRSPRARFPLFGKIFGSKTTTTIKPKIELDAGLLNYFFGGGDKNPTLSQGKNNTVIYTIQDQSGGNLDTVQDIYSSGDSVIYTVQNETGTNIYQSGSGSGHKQTTFITNNENGSTIYTNNAQSGIASNLGQLKDVYASGGSVIYTVQNETGNNFYQPGNGSGNKDTTVLTNNGNGSTMYTIQSGIGMNLGQMKDIYSSDGSVINTLYPSETMSDKNDTMTSTNDKITYTDKTIQNSTGSTWNTNYQIVGGSSNKNAEQTGFSVSSIENTNSLATNIFLMGGKESKPNYLNEDKFTLVEEEVVPNALASTNVPEGNKNSNMVIVICTDPTTGSVVGKYESSNILQEYKDAMVEKEGSTDWASIGDNSSSISLPSQLIVRNISMTIRDRVHYCQIINIANGSLVQGNNGQSMLVDISYDGGAVVENSNSSGTSNTERQENISQIVSSVSPIYVTTELSVGSSSNVGMETQSKNNSSILVVSENKQKEGDIKSKEQDENNKSNENLFISHHTNEKDNDVKIKNKGEDKSNSDENLFISQHQSSLKNKDKLIESHKVSSQELHISSLVGNKNSNKNGETIFYSKKPYISTHGEVPFFSMHVYHHSVEEDSKAADSLEGVFVSKLVKLTDGDEDDDSDDDISSDFAKFNTAAKYAVFRFD